MSNPTISVILPVYNTEEYVKKSIESILSQTFSDFELLIYLDGCTDGSGKMVEEFKDDRIVRITSAKNKGLINALNTMIKVSKGEYLARQDSDDTSLPSRFEKQLSYMRENGSQICGTRAIVVRKDGEKKMTHPENQKEVYEWLENGMCPYPHGSVMIKNGNDIRYNPNHTHAEDLGLWLKLMSKCRQFEMLNETLYRYTERPNNISMSKRDEQKKMTNTICKEYKVGKYKNG